MTKNDLKQAIKAALIQQTAVKTAAEANTEADRIAGSIANAVDAYIVSKLNSLKGVLTRPNAFVAGPPAAVVNASAGIIGYDPNA